MVSTEAKYPVLSGSAPDVLKHDVLAALRSVLDPCSVSAGHPTSLLDMGLITSVAVEADGTVVIEARVTGPGCWFAPAFSTELRARVLEEVDGIGDVTVEMSDRFDWTEADIAPEARRRIVAGRAERAVFLGLPKKRIVREYGVESPTG